jgi:hypothetical protein
MRLLDNLLLRPLRSPTFGGFWRDWNPPLNYVLLYFLYRPIRRLLPKPMAIQLTFAGSGLIHDLIANAGDLLHAAGGVEFSGTLLLGIFGILTVATDAAGWNLSRWPTWVRVSANAGLLAFGFCLRRVLLAAC